MLRREARRQVRQEETRQRRITLMVGTIVLTFLVSWFPFALMFALSPFSQDIGNFFSDNKLVDFVTWLGKYLQCTVVLKVLNQVSISPTCHTKPFHNMNKMKVGRDYFQ